MRDGGLNSIYIYIHTSNIRTNKAILHSYIALFIYNIQRQKIHSKIHGNENESILYFFLTQFPS